MGHIDRHLNKKLSDLVRRQMQDWKLGSGVLYDDYTTEVHNKLKKKKFDFTNEPGIILLTFDFPIGCFIDRQLNIYESNTIRLVISGTNEDYTITTMYPEDNKNRKYIGQYDITQDEYLTSSPLFSVLDILHSHNYTVQLVTKENKPQNSYVKVFCKNDINIKIKADNTLTILTDTYGRQDKYKINYTERNLLTIVEAISSYRETRSNFRKVTILDWIDQQLNQ